MSSKYEPKPGDISVFKNDKKQPGDRQPDYDGRGLDLAGNEVRIALWIKEGRNGKFFSGRLSEPRAKADAPAPPAQTTKKVDDDLPF